MNNNSEHKQLSTISSTASIMKSVIENHNDYSSLTTYEDVNLLAVKRRMMENVDEAIIEHDNNATSYDNASLECHADNTDSFRSDEDNNSIIQESNTLLFQCEVANDNIGIDRQKSSNVIHVADFSSDLTDITKCRSANPNNDEQNSSSSLPQLEFRPGTSVMSAPSEAFLVENPFRRQNDETPSTPSDTFLNEPYAFLRKRSSERLKRLSPTKFHLSAASSSAIDKAVTTAGLLPQLARQCFSFEDTAVNDGTFLAPMPALHEDGDQSINEDDYRLDYRPAFGTTTDCREFDVRKKQCHEPSHRKSRTWSESLPKASSFDAWSPARGGVKKPLMDEDTDTMIKSYKGEQRKYKNIEDWKVSDVCAV
jgi:hypothetical protein